MLQRLRKTAIREGIPSTNYVRKSARFLPGLKRNEQIMAKQTTLKLKKHLKSMLVKTKKAISAFQLLHQKPKAIRFVF